MKIDLNKILSLAIIILGHALFFAYISHNLALAFIFIIGMFLVWILWAKVTDSFIVNNLIYLIAISGFVISITILTFYGIEPIGTRKGVLMRFHSHHIVFAMALFFFTLLPYIILNMKIKLPIQKSKISIGNSFLKNKKQKKQIRDQYIVDDDNWEITSEGDAFSGNYHID